MDNILSEKEAYLAMLYFLEELQQRTNSDDIAGFLGGMQLNKYDDQPMDPAHRSDWLKAVEKVKNFK